MKLKALLLLPLLALSLHAGYAQAQDSRYITVASTTSTQDSGLFDHILPLFTDESSIEVRVVAVGTGQAIKIAERGDADVLLVHDTAAENAFVQSGNGVERFDVMYNDFVIVGPASDPAGIAGSQDTVAALQAIAQKGATFLSRGDDSGTNKAELRLWQEAGVEVKAASGQWYRETGSGMGATLNTAAGMGAYTLADRATWLAFQNKGDLKVLVQGDKRLFNQYGVILVNPSKHDAVKAEEAQVFIDWLLGPGGQHAIASFQIDGQQVFFPNAKRD